MNESTNQFKGSAHAPTLGCASEGPPQFLQRFRGGAGPAPALYARPRAYAHALHTQTYTMICFKLVLLPQ
eukprot:4181550-Lingulodinium_polyedra.AAC.1